MFKSLFLSLVFALTAFAQPATPSTRITDKTGTLSQPTIQALSDQLAALEKKNGAQILVYMDYTLNGVPIEDFGIKAARAWKPGQVGANNGAILFIFKNDRKMRIEVGRGLEAVMTDTKTKSILDDIIRPKFKAGDFNGGIQGGVEAMIKIASGQEAPSASHEFTVKEKAIGVGIGLLILLTIIVFIATGGDIFLPWLIFSTLTGGDDSDSGFGGGGGSFDGGGSSSDW